MDDSSNGDRWGSHATALLREWAAAWDQLAASHHKLSQLCFLGHFLLAAPAVVMPLVFPQVLPEHELAQWFMACSITAGLMSFANLAGLAQRHRTAGHLYVSLRTDLVTEMTRPVIARRQAALAVSDYRSRFLQILSSSPSLPIRCSFCPFTEPPHRDFPEEPDVVRTLEELPPV
jgi:hypothetical protein